MMYPSWFRGSAVGRRILVEKSVVRTSWPVRLAVLAALLVFLALTGRFWLLAVSHSLVHRSELRPADAIIVENLETEYLLYERASRLQREGLAPRVIIPILAPPEDLVHPEGSVLVGLAGVMIRVSRLRDPELVTLRELEPISLNAARQLLEYVRTNGAEGGEKGEGALPPKDPAHDDPRPPVRSVLVVTSGFRSERTYEIYRSVFGSAGIEVQVDPVFALRNPDNWLHSTHGFQEVGLQFGKLWYYRLFVLR